VGSRGDSYDNALAETINGLYKAELIHRRAPWKTKESLELATLAMGVLVQPPQAARSPSDTFPLPKLKKITIGNSPFRQPQWTPDLNQTASMKPGAGQRT
jgi:hypothetical protein